ncbi:MAG TPA: ABC transporter permease [Pseudonocardia sp.]|nr:ABC transporter permease [Pseudonocardia sp.]
MSLTAEPVAAPPGRAAHARRDGHRAVLATLASVLLGLVVWQLLAVRFGPALLASPAETLAAAVELAKDGTLFNSMLASSRRILIGWGLGLLVGAPVGLVMGRMRLVRTLLDPYIEFFRFIPPVAFVTLAVVWFGIGESSKVVLIFYTSVFIVTLNTVAGVLAVSESKLRAAASLGAGRWQTLRHVVLPATVPHVVTGARLAMGNSFLTIVSAEIVAAQVGLGALIWTSRNYGRIDWVFVGIITLGLLGFVFDRVLRIVARRLLGRYGVKL